jgi:phosphoribosylanthranilate isomerase
MGDVVTTKVKICGLTNFDDAIDAIELGADYLGFVFYPESKRYVKPQDFANIAVEIPSEILKVGVFVNADPQFVIDFATQFDLALLQFHGDETPEYCRQFARPYIKAIRPKNEADLALIPSFECEAVLIDSLVGNAYGGSGIVGDWELTRAAKQYGKVFLSGGLNPGNVEMAIHAVKPFAVDVASGVESSPGKKDYRKMEEFIKKAKGM